MLRLENSGPWQCVLQPGLVASGQDLRTGETYVQHTVTTQPPDAGWLLGIAAGDDAYPRDVQRAKQRTVVVLDRFSSDQPKTCGKLCPSARCVVIEPSEDPTFCKSVCSLLDVARLRGAILSHAGCRGSARL